MISAVAAAQSIGAMAGLLGLWLFLCDRRNEFAPWLLGAGLVLLGIGKVLRYLAA